MRKKALYVLLLMSVLAILALPPFVHAQQDRGFDPNLRNDLYGIPPAGNNSESGFGGGTSGGGGASGSWDAPLDIPAIINRIAKWLFDILMAVSVVMILAAAFMHVSSGGNEEKVKTANKMIVYAVVGVAIALLSKVIIAVVEGFVRR